MKPCPACGADNAETSKFCHRCGKPLDGPLPAPPTAPDDATVRWTGRAMPAANIQRTVAVETLFGTKSQLLIGRAPECGIYLPHPTVSRHHAVLERHDSGLRLRDLNSVNGVHVGGRLISEPVLVKEQERVGIGPFLFCLSAGVIHVLDSSRSLRLEARGLEKTIGQGPGRVRKLLDNINLAVEPGEFVSLLGPSGSGKSTLMDCLNGRRPATGGKVLANGEDFYLHFDNFRQSLGYVPQRDIVHSQLTVFRALYYTAQLRLPTDTGPAELTARIEEVLQQMELGPHRDTLIGNLSGGQIKRVSLGAELLARPCLLYIDEATSGLDAGTEARMMKLFRQLADEGKSVICITHNVDNVDLCNHIIVLARGKLVYFGPPAEARAYFGVSRISEIYDQLAGKEPEKWESEFAACPLHQEFVAGRLAVPRADTLVPRPPAAAAPESPPLSHSSSAILLPNQPGPPARPPRPPLWHQFRVLLTRYVELIWNDRHGLRLLLLQAPVVALFILLGFTGKPYQQKILAPRKLSAEERESLKKLAALIRTFYERNKEQINSLQPRQQAMFLREKLIDLQKQFWVQQALPPAEQAALRYLIILTQQTARLEPREQVPSLIRLLDELSQTDAPAVPDRMIISPRYTFMLLFLMVLIILWFGCNNASKEIVKEEAIYGRERAVNLGILPYLASKFLVLSVITAVQSLMLMVLIYGILGFLGWQFGQSVPEPLYYLPYLPQFGVFVVLSMTSVAMGLLLSACVSTPDRANALLPYVLIPQIILGGGFLFIKDGPLYFVAVALSPAYWAYRAVHVGTHDVLPPDVPGHTDYTETVWLPVLALTVQMAVLLVLTAWFLRQKDVRRA
jgi:ABC-type multidrug transport system ATPase subunit